MNVQASIVYMAFMMNVSIKDREEKTMVYMCC